MNDLAMKKCPQCQKANTGKEEITLSDGTKKIAYTCRSCGLGWYTLAQAQPTDLITQKEAAGILGQTIQEVNGRIVRGTLIGYKSPQNHWQLVSRAAVMKIKEKLDAKRARQAQVIAEQVSDGGRNDPSENFG